jgi:hypothetical protein
VAQKAYESLGEQGKIRSAAGHMCAECTHLYKKASDIITENNPAAVVGVDENRVVPALIGEEAGLALQEAAQARRIAADARAQPPAGDDGDAMDVDDRPKGMVNMVVIDGIVMGHAVSYCL